MTAVAAARSETVPSTSTVNASSDTGTARVSPITSLTRPPNGSRIAYSSPVASIHDTWVRAPPSYQSVPNSSSSE